MKKLFSLFSILLVCSCVSIPKPQRLVGGDSGQIPTTGDQELKNMTADGVWRSLKGDSTFKVADTVWMVDTVYTLDGVYRRADGRWVHIMNQRKDSIVEPVKSDTAVGGQIKIDGSENSKLTTVLTEDTAKLKKYGRQTGLQFVGITGAVTTQGGIGVTGTVMPRDTFSLHRVEVIHDSTYIYKDSTRQLKALFSLVDSLKVTVVGKTTEAITYHGRSLYYLWWAIVSTVGLITLTFLYFLRWRD